MNRLNSVNKDLNWSKTGSRRYWTPQILQSVKAYPATKVQLTLTTYDGSGETIHPSVVAIPAGWNGYKYWMANTPLPQSQGSPSDYENPSIWASNDGVTWDVPVGLTNPIVAKPAGGYNSDTDIFYNTADNKLYVIWKDSTGGNVIKIISSSDGITWGNIHTVLTRAADETECLSPSLIKIGSKYYIYYGYYLTDPSDLAHTGIRRVFCNTIDGTYGTREEIIAPPNAGYHWWHFDISYINGLYWICASQSAGNSSGDIYILRSTDGVTFVNDGYFKVHATANGFDNNGCYHSSIALIEGQYVLYYGCLSPAVVKSSTGMINIDFVDTNTDNDYALFFLTDITKTVNYSDFTEEATISKVGALVSKVDDKSGSLNHFLQAGADNIKPTWDAEGLLCDGVRQFIKTAPFAYSNPQEFVFLVFKQVTWTLGDYIMDGDADNSMLLRQRTATPGFAPYAGNYLTVSNDLAVNTWGIVRILYNEASSKLIVDNNAPITGDVGVGDAGGITLGSVASGIAANCSNIKIKGGVWLKIIPTAVDEVIIYNFLASKYGLPTI